MKTNIKGLITVLSAMAVLFACETETAELYKPETDGMYFTKLLVGVDEMVDDTTRLAFGNLPDPTVESAIFTVPVLLMGSVADYDREFHVETMKEANNSGTRYEIIQPSILKAGATEADIEIKLWKTENLSVRDTIIIQLVDSPDLRVMMKDFSTRCITFYKGYDRPEWWTDSYTEYNLGGFHEIKMEILFEVLGSTDNPCSDTNRWKFYQLVLNDYCKDNDIRDPDTGEIVTFLGTYYGGL